MGKTVTHQKERDVVLDAALDVLRPDENGDGIVSALDELSNRRMVRDILDTYHFQSPSAHHGPKHLMAWGAIAAGVALLMAGWFLLEIPRTSVTPISSARIPMAQDAKPVQISGGRFALLKGDVRVGQNRAQMGDAVLTKRDVATGQGEAAIELPTGITVGLSKHSLAAMRWDGTARYGVSLKRGMALFSVDPSEVRDAFYVDTPLGRISVEGTLFTVVVRGSGVYVQLHRGSVTVRQPGKQPRKISQGDLVSLQESSSPHVETEVSKQVLGQLQALQCINMGMEFGELPYIGCHHKPKQSDNVQQKTVHSVATDPSSHTNDDLGNVSFF